MADGDSQVTWKDKVLRGFKIKDCILKSVVKHENEKGLEETFFLYLSFADCNFNELTTLPFSFDKNYQIISKKTKKLFFNLAFNELRSELKNLIKGSNMFIAYVTEDYFDCDVSFREFDFAMDTKKPILCLLTPHLKNLEEIKVEKDDNKMIIIQKYLRIMRTLNTYELPYNQMNEMRWHEISKPLTVRVKEIIDGD